MTPEQKHESRYRAAWAVTLLAWLMLLGQSVAHAGDASHANLPSAHCVICSAGNIDDDIDTPSSIAESTIQPTAVVFVLPSSATKVPGIPSKHTAARAPPFRR